MNKKEVYDKELYKKLNLKWFALISDLNTDEIKSFNIFNNPNIWNKLIGLPKILKKYTTYEDFKDELSKLLKYCFRSKAEYEILISGMFSKSKTYKIDVWNQLEPNLDLIARYVIEEYNKHKRKKIEVNE